MIKFLTITFLIYYTIRIINPSLMIGTLNNFVDLLNKYESIEDKEEQNDFITQAENLTLLIKTLTFSLIQILISIVELYYIIAVIPYGCTTITLGYLIWWSILFLYGVIRNKLKKDKKLTKIKKFSFSRMVILLLDVFYFSYMYFILFLA